MVGAWILRVLLILGLVVLLIPVSLAYAGAGSGTVVVHDSVSDDASSGNLGDNALISMTSVPDAADGTFYEGWFVSDDESLKVSTGPLNVSDGMVDQVFSYTENILGGFDKFEVTVESSADSDPGASDVVAYSYQIPADGAAHIRHLVFSFEGNPAYTSGPHAGLPKGIAVGLREQTNEALTYAKLAQTSAQAGNTTDAQLHSCHVVNILSGYDKANVDDPCPGPGDGFGALNYAADASKHADLTRDAVPDNLTFAKYAGWTISASNEVTDIGGRALSQATLAKDSSDLLATTLFINNVARLLSDEEGGALNAAQTAYTSSQGMGTYTLASLPSVGEPLIPQLASGVLIAGIVLAVAGIALVVGIRPRLMTT
jgi:hypothetical protein